MADKPTIEECIAWLAASSDGECEYKSIERQELCRDFILATLRDHARLKAMLDDREQ